jgi:hypothetical protein
MFLQQTFASVGKVLPAVVAPLVIAELDADPAWVGVYYGIAAAAALFAQMGCGSFMTGGVLSFGQVGALLGPSTFALLLRLTGGYSIGWALCAGPALWVGVNLLRSPPPVERGEALTARTAGITRSQG